jgi:hypothetical protein
MGISVRYFVFENDGALKSIARRTVDGLIHEQDAIPAYADTTQKVAEVVVENEGGRPARILDAKGRYWAFKADGRLSMENVWRAADLFPAPKPSAGSVVDLRPELARKKWRSAHIWDVTKDDLDRILAAMMPTAAAISEVVQTVKGKSPRKPPLTYQAEQASREISLKLSEIEWKLDALSEPSLKSLAFHCRDMATERASASLWKGVAEIADRKREIKARHRTGRGKWFAIVELLMWDIERNEGRELETIEEKCNTRKEALAAARRLLAEHAHRLDENVTVEATVKSELEWPLTSAFEGSESA